MTNVFSSMEYPHWLLVAGAILVVLGFIGLAFRPSKNVEAKLKEKANGNEQGRSDLAELGHASRKAMLAQQTRQRWSNKDRDSKEEPSDTSATSRE